MRIVECVPNISEGRDRAVIDAVSGVIHQVEGCELLDVDPGAATNRTVITFVGSPEAVVEGAFQLISKARELIDMRQHHGEHPRFGATDVCPFVPVSGVTMEDCAEGPEERPGLRPGRVPPPLRGGRDRRPRVPHRLQREPELPRQAPPARDRPAGP